MELKEYLAIFRKDRAVLFWSVIICLAMGLGLKLYQPLTYRVSLNLNVTRDGSQATDQYRYDDYYRLQADDRFADTVVRWLASARIATDILDEFANSAADKASPPQALVAKKLSNQFLLVTFVVRDPRLAKPAARAVVTVLNRETDKLNVEQHEINWFQLIGSEPVVEQNSYSWAWILSLSFVFGLFLSVWVVLIRHYFSK
ncbi:hypothetical protein EPO05_02255 [Patescibacteria group bacterium]|nr:MAG: hypothetical protein EPO05_02255 [Patescibacteria group bacterium]